MASESENIIIDNKSEEEKNKNIVRITDENIIKLLEQGTTYFDILLFNCYNEEDKTIDKEKISKAFDDLLGIYSNLFNFGISLSGYQFVGIMLENNLSLTETDYTQLAYFILSTGFLISMFGVLLCFITMEFLYGCREEEPEFIIVGVHKYKRLFKLADIILYADSILFTIPINILIHNSMGEKYAYSYNILCSVFFTLGMLFHYTVIISRQQYNISIEDIEKDDNFNADILGGFFQMICGSNDYKYKRKLFRLKEKTKNI